METTRRPVVLTIAGSDPSGGAGLQADLKTFHQFGVYGAAAVTLLTVQNTVSVSRVETMPPDLVAAQAEAVLSDLPVAAVKTGALGDAAIAQAVAGVLRGRGLPLVVDPVAVSKHGAPLLRAADAAAVAAALFPLAALVAPNLHEAALFLGRVVENLPAMREAARDLARATGAKAVLVKGGHLEDEALRDGSLGDGSLRDGSLRDVLWDGERFFEYPSRRIDTPHTHGTGCTYAAAIAALLGRGFPVSEAVGLAHAFLHRAIVQAPGLGHGHGPVDHFAAIEGD